MFRLSTHLYISVRNMLIMIGGRSRAYALEAYPETTQRYTVPYTYSLGKLGESGDTWVLDQYKHFITNDLRWNWVATRRFSTGNNITYVWGLLKWTESGADLESLYEYNTQFSKTNTNVNSGYLAPVLSFPKTTYDLDTSTTPAQIVKK